jgi:hypothetical protein
MDTYTHTLESILTRVHKHTFTVTVT